MDHRRNAGRAYILFALSLCLPWFTFNPKVMGYCHGYAFLRYLLVPMGVLALCLVCRGQRGLRILLSELSLAAILGTVIGALGAWQEVGNIKEGFDWATGLRTAVPTYWLSVILTMVLAVMTQLALFKPAGKKM